MSARIVLHSSPLRPSTVRWLRGLRFVPAFDGWRKESSSPYFLRLEKKRAVDRWIPALRESGGSIVSSPEGLCRTLNTFYSDLFSSVPTDSVIQASLLSNFPCPLTCDQACV